MKKQTYYKVVAGLTLVNIVWAFGYAIVRDLYPELSGLRDVLHVKAVVNGFLTTGAWMGLIPVMMHSKDPIN